MTRGGNIRIKNSFKFGDTILPLFQSVPGVPSVPLIKFGTPPLPEKL
jgi:hypothetical protein